MRIAAHVVTLVTILGVAAGSPVTAATLTVTNLSDSGSGSLRQAIIDANDSSGADTIEFADGLTGTITLSSPLPVITTGLTLAGPGRDMLTIDAAGTGPVFQLESTGSFGNDTAFRDVTITGGVEDSEEAVFAGGVYVVSGRYVEFDRVRISDNSGGGIEVNTDSPGVLIVMRDSLVTDNRAEDGAGLRAPNCENHARIERSTFTGNEADDGGGAIQGCANFTILDSTIAHNEASWGAGVDLSLSGIPDILIRNTTISNNRGGGLAMGHRGGSTSPFVTLEHVTIAHNTAPPSGGDAYGLRRQLPFDELTLTIRNSLIAHNETADCNGDVADAGSHRLDSDGTCGFDTADDLPATDPMLDDLADNSGPTRTHALLAGSPAVDSAGTAACPPADQRQVSRPQDGNGDGLTECDLGAFELPAAGGACEPGPGTLCLNRGRFQVTARWEDSAGRSGYGHVVPLTGDTGSMWFFSPDNFELMIKVLDGCAVNGRHWVFIAGLTDVEVDLTVTDTETGSEQTYTSALGEAFEAIQDTGAFATCP